VLTGLLLALAYLCGSIPSGVLLARRRGIDVRQSGSGNIGATNVARSAGMGLGILTLLLDVLKGFVPTLIARIALSDAWAVGAVGLAAFAGHLFPVFLRFSGGKGVATAGGVYLALAPAALGISITVFTVAAVLSRYVSLASVLASVALPIACLGLGYPPSTSLFAGVVAVLIVLRHRSNLRRLIRGDEPPFRARH
jgi:acyl phosphate:glycerol-3-phosphate acyltransferase